MDRDIIRCCKNCAQIHTPSNVGCDLITLQYVIDRVLDTNIKMHSSGSTLLSKTNNNNAVVYRLPQYDEKGLVKTPGHAGTLTKLKSCRTQAPQQSIPVMIPTNRVELLCDRDGQGFAETYSFPLRDVEFKEKQPKSKRPNKSLQPPKAFKKAKRMNQTVLDIKNDRRAMYKLRMQTRAQKEA